MLKRVKGGVPQEGGGVGGGTQSDTHSGAGAPITETDNALDVFIKGGVSEFEVVNVIEELAFDLQAAAFNMASSETEDYQLDSIDFEFSTTEERTIKVTAANGAVLYEKATTSLSVSLTEIAKCFDGGDDFRVQITQLTSAGTVDVTAVIKRGSASFGGSTFVALDFETEVSRGNLAGLKPVKLLGKNPDVNSSMEDIHDAGGDYEGFEATVAETLRISSDDGADDVGGTGAITMLVEGLDGTFMEISETVTLDGMSDVFTLKSYLRHTKTTVKSAGSGGANAGTITLDQSTSGKKMGQINPGNNRTFGSYYTIPAGKQALPVFGKVMNSLKINAFTEAILNVRPLGEVFSAIEIELISSSGVSNSEIRGAFPDVLAEKTDLIVRANSNVNNTVVATKIELLLIG